MGTNRAKPQRPDAPHPLDAGASPSAPGVGYEDLTEEQVDRIRGILEPMVSVTRRARIEEVLSHRTREVVLVLENIYSDHNSAAVLRTADAMGLTEVHHLSDADEIRLSRRVALGSEKWLDTVRHSDPGRAFEELRRRGYSVWGAAVHGDPSLLEALPDGPLALVFGNEHRGLSEAALDRCDGCFRIPMYGFAESYNISVAAALALSATVAARRREGRLPGLAPRDRDRLRVAWLARSVRAAPALLGKEGLPLPLLASARYVDPES